MCVRSEGTRGALAEHPDQPARSCDGADFLGDLIWRGGVVGEEQPTVERDAPQGKLGRVDGLYASLAHRVVAEIQLHPVAGVHGEESVEVMLAERRQHQRNGVVLGRQVGLPVKPGEAAGHHRKQGNDLLGIDRDRHF